MLFGKTDMALRNWAAGRLETCLLAAGHHGPTGKSPYSDMHRIAGKYGCRVLRITAPGAAVGCTESAARWACVATEGSEALTGAALAPLPPTALPRTLVDAVATVALALNACTVWEYVGKLMAVSATEVEPILTPTVRGVNPGRWRRMSRAACAEAWPPQPSSYSTRQVARWGYTTTPRAACVWC